MFIIAFALWVLIWGAAGYFIVRTILIRREKKRLQEMMAHRLIMQHQMEAAKKHGIYTTVPMLFMDFNKNEG